MIAYGELYLMVIMNSVRFLTSEEDLASGPGTRLDHSIAFMSQSFIKV